MSMFIQGFLSKRLPNKKYTKKNGAAAILLVFFAGCLQPEVEEPDYVKRPEPSPVIPIVNYVEVFTDQQYENVKASLAGKPAVEYYSAVWCGYCKQQTPILKELADKHKNITVLKIDVDTCQKTTKEAGVKSLPTTIVNGKKFVGLTNLSKLEESLK